MAGKTANQTKRPWLAISIIVILILICCAPCLLLWAIYFRPQQVFREQELNAIPLFDAQNDAVLAEIPPPPGVVEIEHIKYGIDGKGYITQHGRDLTVKYHPLSMSPKDIALYYRQLMIPNGWKNLPYDENNVWDTAFFRGTSCVNVYLDTRKPEIDTYKIVIWHDFDKQAFSPPRPNLPDLKALVGESYSLHCP